MYERAIARYQEYGFPNNAIALCNKVLRNAPGRTQIYLRLAQLMVERGFVAEAKQNLLEYADRMQKAGKTDEAFRALKEFADLSPDSEEIRLLLAEQLKSAARDSEAREQLAKLYAEAESTGDQRRSRMTLQHIRAIDPEFDVASAPKPKVAEKKQKTSELIFLNLDDEEEPDAGPAAAVEEPAAEPEPLVMEPTAEPEPELAAEPEMLEIEPTSLDGGATDEVETEGLAIEQTSLADETPADDVGALEGLDLTQGVAGADEIVEEAPAAESEPAESLEIERLDIGGDEELEVESLEPAGAGDEDISIDADLPVLDVGADSLTDISIDEPKLDVPDLELGEAAEAAEAPRSVEELYAAVADDPDDAELHVTLGEMLIEQGDRDGGLTELDIAVDMFETAEEWDRAEGLATEVLRLDPNNVRYRQKQVEYAFRSGEKPPLIAAYLGLADALFREGTVDRALAVYKRVLEHDPENQRALDGIATLAPPEEPATEPEPEPEARPEDFVDLGALVLDEEPVRDTRMRVEDEEPSGDEERDFHDMLAQFKRGIEENISEDDAQAHYDLGVAFKEMGLLDEAIAEFQKALRSSSARLRTAEALGSCFFEKRQYSVAATVMRRAIDADPAGDEDKIGLLYSLGRCEEEQHRGNEALAYYQRVFALDINFQDVSQRLEQLSAAEN